MSATLKQLAATLPPLDAPPEAVSRACKLHILRHAFFHLARQQGIPPDRIGPLPLPLPTRALPPVALDPETLQRPGDLGRLYEALLDVTLSRDGAGWRVARRARRRQTGSHYTPPALAQQVVADAVRAHGGKPVRIFDPAMGTGAFLLAARRLLPQAALFGADVDSDAVAVARMALWLAQPAAVAPRDLLAEQLVAQDALVETPPADAFDLVLGNPPYIPFYGRGSQASRFPKGYRERIRALHGTLDGADAIGSRLNLFLVFCVRATTLLAPDGVAAMVLPDTVLTNASYAPLRAALCRSGRLRSATRHGDGVFPGATVGTAVVMWGAPRGEGTATATLSEAGSDPIVEPTAALLQRPRVTWLPMSTETLRARTISGAATIPLGEIAVVRDGINTGSRRMRQRLLCAAHDGDPTLRPVIEGRCIQPYRLTSGRLWVRYNPALLKDGREGASLGSRAVFDAPKIVYRQTASHPIAAVDLEGRCYRNSAHGVVLHAHDETVLWALCGYLNAAKVRTHHQTVTGETRRTFPQVHVSTMKRLPVPRRLLDPQDLDVQALAAAAQRADQEAVDAIVDALLV